MSAVRPIVAFFVCLLVSLAVLDIGILLPDFVQDNGGSDSRQLVGALSLVNSVAAPVVAFGGFLAGFFVLTGNRENGNSRHLAWMMIRGALSGAVYGALASFALSRSFQAFLIGALAGLVAGALCGGIWCVIVERPRHA